MIIKDKSHSLSASLMRSKKNSKKTHKLRWWRNAASSTRSWLILDISKLKMRISTIKSLSQAKNMRRISFLREKDSMFLVQLCTWLIIEITWLRLQLLISMANLWLIWTSIILFLQEDPDQVLIKCKDLVLWMNCRSTRKILKDSKGS